MADPTFTIGEAAKRAGVSPDTLRHYERVGLLPRAPRTTGGYRYYTDATVVRVLFVRNAIRFGFSMKELSGFLDARDHGCPPCQSVRAAGERLLREMDRELSELTAARASMTAALAGWDAKLARTPHGAAAHLLADLPKLPGRPALRSRARRQGQ
ncbi:MAG: MerR family DNA-binding transcriptional regulator [Vicinamibacterales bacterium]